LESELEIDQYFGLADIWLLPMYQYWPKRPIKVGLSICWQNTVLFLMHPDNLRKEAQWTKSWQLSCINA